MASRKFVLHPLPEMRQNEFPGSCHVGNTSVDLELLKKIVSKEAYNF